MIGLPRLLLSVNYIDFGRTLLDVSRKFRVRNYLCQQKQGLVMPCFEHFIRGEKVLIAFHRQL